MLLLSGPSVHGSIFGYSYCLGTTWTPVCWTFHFNEDTGVPGCSPVAGSILIGVISEEHLEQCFSKSGTRCLGGPSVRTWGVQGCCLHCRFTFKRREICSTRPVNPSYWKDWSNSRAVKSRQKKTVGTCTELYVYSGTLIKGVIFVVDVCCWFSRSYSERISSTVNFGRFAGFARLCVGEGRPNVILSAKKSLGATGLGGYSVNVI